MPIANSKTLSIILEKCNDIDERCDGYRKEITQAISEILLHERGHRSSATNIQKKINDRCSTAGLFLATKRGLNSRTEEVDS